jgi:hypothetical protein
MNGVNLATARFMPYSQLAQPRPDSHYGSTMIGATRSGGGGVFTGRSGFLGSSGETSGTGRWSQILVSAGKANLALNQPLAVRPPAAITCGAW